MPNPRPTLVAARVTTQDVQRKFYAAQDSWDIWIEEMEVAADGGGTQLIVMNDATGQRSRVPVTLGEGDGEDAVEFGEAIPVITRYEDAAVAASRQSNVVRFASKAESRPDAPNASATEPRENNTKEEANVPNLTEVAKRLGVAEDADDATILAALDEALNEQVAPAPAPATIPEGAVLVDASILEDLKRSAAAGAAAREQQVQERQTSLLAAAVKEGKITRASSEKWKKRFKVDPEGAEADLASLEPGLVPMASVGHAGTVDGVADSGPSAADMAAAARAFGGFNFSTEEVRY